MKELIKLIEAFTGKELDADVVSKAELDEEVLKALKEQLSTVEKYKNDLPTAVVSAIGEMAARAAFGITKTGDAGDADDKDKDNKVDVEKFIDTVVEKAGAKFSKATQELLNDFLEKMSKEIESLRNLMDVKKSRAADGDGDADDDKELTAEEIEKMFADRASALTG